MASIGRLPRRTESPTSIEPGIQPSLLTTGISRKDASSREARHILPLMLTYALANVLAYGRDASILAVFGSTAETDAYLVGTFVPILLSTIIVSASLVPAFLPALAGYAHDKNAAMRVANATVFWVTIVLGLVSVLVFLFAEQVMSLMAPGWEADQLELAAFLLRVTSPITIALGLSAVLAAIGNAYDRYIIPPLGLAASNAFVIIITLTVAPNLGIVAPALGLLFGSVLQVAIQVLALWNIGVRPIAAPGVPTGATSAIAKAFAPMIAISFLAQSVPFFERWLGSGLDEGQLSYIIYAGKLTMIPVTIISTSNLVVFFVAMSRDGALQDLSALRATLGRGARLTVYLLMMASIVLITLGQTLVTVTLQRGKFTGEDAVVTASLLGVYAFAIIPNGLSALVTRSYQARRVYWVPLRTSIINTFIYLAAGIILFDHLGAIGLALAFVIGQTAGVILLHAQQPPALRKLTRNDVKQVAKLLTVAFASIATITLFKQVYASLGMFALVGNLPQLLLGCLTILAVSVFTSRIVHLEEGKVVEGWIKSLVVSPIYWLRGVLP